MTLRVLAVDAQGRPSLCEIMYPPERFADEDEGEKIELRVPASKIHGSREGRVYPRHVN